MDSATVLYTLIFSGIIIGAITFMLFFPNSVDPTFKYVISGIMLAALVSAYLMIPKFFIANRTIYIKNFFVTIKVPATEIAGIERFEKVGFNIRTFGVSGLFGYFGYFNGNDVWYVTNIKKKIKIILKGGKIIMISPEDSTAFLTAVGAQISGES